MKKIKTREEFESELSSNVYEELINEEEMVEVSVKLEENPEPVESSLKSIENVKIKQIFPFGVIDAIVPKKRINDIRNIEGVEDIEIKEKQNETRSQL